MQTKQITYKSHKGNDIETDSKKGIVTIYVSSFGNKDSDGDIIQKGAFTKTIAESMHRIKHLKDHDRYILLGIPLEMIQDNIGLKVRSAMIMKKPVVQDTFAEYEFLKENGRSLEHSIGFTIPAGKYIYDEKADAHFITEIKLFEYSTISLMGANEMTPLIDIKSLFDNKGNLDYIVDELEKRLKFDYSNETLTRIENNLTALTKNYESFVNTLKFNKSQETSNILIKNILKNL